MINIIGLAGDAGAGKDTVAKYMLEYGEELRLKSKLYKFATPIYELAAALLGVTVGTLERRASKEMGQWFTITQTCLEQANDVWIKYGLDRYEDFSYIWPIFLERGLLNLDYEVFSVESGAMYGVFTSPRYILQVLGTELGREMLDTDVWIKTVFYSIEQDEVDLAVIGDVRFPNEALTLRGSNNPSQGLSTAIINIERPSNVDATKNTGHISEQGIDPKLIDVSLINDKDLSHLKFESNYAASILVKLATVEAE